MSGFDHEDLKPVHRTFRVLHFVWALLCAGVSAFLASVGGGHPPPIVFVPVVLVAWAIGHIGLWVGVALAPRGHPARQGTRWPPGVGVVLAGLAAMTMLTLFQLAVSVQLGRFYPYRGSLWFLMLGAGAVHALALVGMLLRQGWARGLSALTCFGWSALMVSQVIEQLSNGRPVSAGDGALALVLFAFPAALGLHLMFSARVREFFEPSC